MDTLREIELVYTSLESSLQEILNFKSQYVIELHASFIEHADANQTTNEGIAFKETFRIFFVKGEKLTGGC